jgi:hypothetical protein
MEPFSILLGTVSVLISVVTTFGGHIENINNRRIAYITCKGVLRGYKSKLEDLADQIKKWEKIWYRQGYDIGRDDRATYDFLWGEAGYNRIVDIANEISTGFNDIAAMFRFRHASSARFDWNGEDVPEELRGQPGSLIRRWNEFLENTGTVPMPHFYEKFAFAIYKNAAFKACLEKLEMDVKDIKDTSTRYFSQRHDIEFPNPPIRENVRPMRDFHVEHRHFLRFFQRFRQWQEGHTVNDPSNLWQIVFAQRPPENPVIDVPTADCQLHEETIEKAVNALTWGANLICTMYTETWNWSRSQDDPLVNAAMVEMIYPTDVPDYSAGGFAAQLTEWNQRNNPAVDIDSRCTFTYENANWQNIRNMLRDGPDPRTSSEPQTVFRQILHHYRLILSAAGVSRTLVLFYGSQLVRDLCSCQIMRARPVESPLREIITRFPNEIDFDNAQKPSVICQHIPEYGKYLSFVLLAVFLAEMAIVAPIDIEYLQATRTADSFNGDVRFRLPHYVQLPDGLTNPLTASQLVSSLEQLKPRVKTLHVGIKYKKAVEECLATRQRFLRRRTGVLKAGDLDRCIEDIVKPYVTLSPTKMLSSDLTNIQA